MLSPTALFFSNVEDHRTTLFTRQECKLTAHRVLQVHYTLDTTEGKLVKMEIKQQSHTSSEITQSLAQV